mmetsp:Transcript_106908/g.297717  ORF Transcript_106908/g.297717 Transcript_106908/m.297717 type:complete len:328 (+) Transcript_106908:84-1067(+)
MTSFPVQGEVHGKWKNDEEKEGPFGILWDTAPGSSSPIRIRNCGKIVRLTRMDYTLEHQILRVDFSFDDVDAHVVLFRDGQGVELQGTFKSGRDKGTYLAFGETNQRSHEEPSSTRARSRSRSRGGSGRFLIESHGTNDEPVFVVRNADGRRGAEIRDKIRNDFTRRGLSVPTPGANDKWESWRAPGAPEGRSPVSADSLNTLADRILEQLRTDFRLVRLVTAPDRGYFSRNVLVYSGGSGKNAHRDSEPAGSLVFVFCAGLSCRSSAWPGNQQVTVQLDSGDCMIFDGRRTKHQVHKCIPGTSPFPHDDWLGSRRLATLNRQRPPR